MIPGAELPLIETLPAHGITPIALSREMVWGEFTFLLDGSQGGWFDGHFSLLGGLPFGIFWSKNESSHFNTLVPGLTKKAPPSTVSPLAALQFWLDQFQVKTHPEDDLTAVPFAFGGVLGFFSYELAYQLEAIPRPQEASDFPDIYLLFLNCYLLLDHRSDLIYLIYNPMPEIRMGREQKTVVKEGKTKIEAMKKQVIAATSSQHPAKQDNFLDTSACFKVEATTDCSPENYFKMVSRAKTYITEGDIFQANLSHQFSAACPFPSLFDVYQRLWQINPSPFSSYLELGELQIASGSPERLVRVKRRAENQIVETRPIAGTRPRGITPAQDKALIASLYESEKERAEHLMLIDLERNDLGKICRFGTVSVDSMMTLETYSHVFHLVSNIEGELIHGTSPLQIIKALFPGGTITGVPKIRCMEIIAELEQKPRGIYTGSIGYIGFDGEMDLNIAIRTWVRKKDVMMFRVGAGIVADSDPRSEYQETLQKAAALMEALHTAY